MNEHEKLMQYVTERLGERVHTLKYETSVERAKDPCYDEIRIVIAREMVARAAFSQPHEEPFPNARRRVRCMTVWFTDTFHPEESRRRCAGILDAVYGELVEQHRMQREPLPEMEPRPVPMLIICPRCHKQHIDDGEFAAKPHKSHACQGCGLVWAPALVPTVGVQFLPGCKNEVK